MSALIHEWGKYPWMKNIHIWGATCFVPEISSPMTGYRGGVQLVKAGDRGGVRSKKWSHLTRKLRDFSNI